jgi:hypothetical protein
LAEAEWRLPDEREAGGRHSLSIDGRAPPTQSRRWRPAQIGGEGRPQTVRFGAGKSKRLQFAGQLRNWLRSRLEEFQGSQLGRPIGLAIPPRSSETSPRLRANLEYARRRFSPDGDKTWPLRSKRNRENRSKGLAISNRISHIHGFGWSPRSRLPSISPAPAVTASCATSSISSCAGAIPPLATPISPRSLPSSRRRHRRSARACRCCVCPRLSRRRRCRWRRRRRPH